MGYGGADRVTLNLLLDFDRTKYDCELAIMQSSGEFLKEIPADVKVHSLSARNLLFFIWPLSRFLFKKQFDFLYSTCSGTNSFLIISKILSRNSGKVIISERNIMNPPGKVRYKLFILNFLKRISYKYAWKVTAVSQELANDMEQGLGIKKVFVVNNPIINEVLKNEKEEDVKIPEFNSDIPVILAVGRFEYQKDYDNLLSAFKTLLDDLPAKLYILGKGPLLNYYKEKTKMMGIEKSVVFAGFDKNPFKLMNKCDAFVLSSRHEGMPGVLIQAMACGAACVSTNCPTGPKELIKNGVNGLLVKMENSTELYKALKNILTDSELKNKLKRNAPIGLERFEEKEAIESYFCILE